MEKVNLMSGNEKNKLVQLSKNIENVDLNWIRTITQMIIKVTKNKRLVISLVYENQIYENNYNLPLLLIDEL